MTSTFGIAAPFIVAGQFTAVGPPQYGHARRPQRSGRTLMLTRRRFLDGALGAGLTLATSRQAAAQGDQLGRNKAVVRAFKDLQGTTDEALIEREVLAPNYKRWRGGFAHLAANAQGQGFPSAGSYLRGAFPDRKDEIVDMVAEGDMVAMLFRIKATHQASFNGIPPTGKKIDVYEAGVFRLADGKITEAWFMADEAGLLKQPNAKLPARQDGKLNGPSDTSERREHEPRA